MKYSKFIPAGLAAFLITTVFAIQGPEDDAPPPPVVAHEAAALPEFKLPPNNPTVTKPEKAVKKDVAFLGVVSGEVPKQLTEHLGLKIGEGVIVRAISPDSPAMRAGIVVNDVITAIAGHPIASQKELSNHVVQSAPGAKVDVNVIHKGKLVNLSVTLGARPADVAISEAPIPDQLDLDRLPKEMADHIRQALGGKEFKLGVAGDQIPEQMEDAIRELENRMRNGKNLLDDVVPPPAADPQVKATSSATFRMMDQDGSIEVKSKDGSKEVVVKDLQGNEIWRGPWNSEEDLAAAPEPIRKRMGNLRLDMTPGVGGLKFNFNGGNHLPPPDR